MGPRRRSTRTRKLSVVIYASPLFQPPTRRRPASACVITWKLIHQCDDAYRKSIRRYAREISRGCCWCASCDRDSQRLATNGNGSSGGGNDEALSPKACNKASQQNTMCSSAYLASSDTHTHLRRWRRERDTSVGLCRHGERFLQPLQDIFVWRAIF